MLEGLYAAAAGMRAQQRQLDTIAGNLANVSTTGYHARREAFTDLLYSEVKESGTETKTGAGAAAIALGESATPGALRSTGKPLDLAISGEGYFELKRASGQLVLTRNGEFSLDGAGRVVASDGSLLNPPITVPAGTPESALSLDSEGNVKIGEKAIGKIALVTVAAPDRMLAAGSGAFLPTGASGAAKSVASPDLISGVLEGSDVEMASELAQMALTQRGYQMSASAVQIEGQMMTTADQIYTQA